MPDQPDPPATQSGGINLNAEGDVNIGGDVVGRDKIVNIHQRPEAKPEPKFLVPFPPNKNFVGRADDIERLHAMLQSGEAAGAGLAVLTGLGGIGKTQLAVEYAPSRLPSLDPWHPAQLRRFRHSPGAPAAGQR